MKSLLPTLLLLPPLLTAQGTFQGKRHSIPFAPAGAGSAFREACSGDFDGDTWPDVAQAHDGNRVFVAFAPAEYEAIAELTVPALDVATLPAGGPGGADALLCATPAGLTLATVDPGTGLFVYDDDFAPLQGAAAFVGVGDFVPHPGNEIVAVDADLLTVRVWSEDGALELASFSSPSPVLDVLPLRWLGGDVDEIVILGTTEMTIHDPLDSDNDGNTAIYSLGSLAPGGSIGRVGQADKAYERLAWVTASGVPGEQYLFVLSALEPYEWVQFGALGSVASAAGDYDADGFDDLLFSHRFSHELLGLVNARTTGLETSFTGSPAQIAMFPYGPPGMPAPSNGAQPLFEDLDNDGDVDAYVAAESSATLEFLHGEGVPEDDYKVSFVGTPEFEDLPDSNSLLHIVLDGPAVMPPGATTIQVDLWVQASASAPFARQGKGRLELPITSWPRTIAVPVPASGVLWEEVYGLDLRLVGQGLDGAFSYPGLIGLFTMRGDVLEVLTKGFTEPFTPVILQAEGPAPTIWPGGGIVCRPRVGPFSRGGGPRQ